MSAPIGLWGGFRPAILLVDSDEGYAVRGGALAVGVGECRPDDRDFRRDASGVGFRITQGLLFRHYYDGHAALGSALAIGVGNALADNGGSNRPR